MSTYATIQGRIKYENKEAYQKAVRFLVDGHWVSTKDKRWVDSDSQESAFNDSGLVINIPYGYYRNLCRYVGAGDILFEGAKEAHVCMGSTDGSNWLYEGVVNDGSVTTSKIENIQIKMGEDDDDEECWERIEATIEGFVYGAGQQIAFNDSVSRKKRH